ncbi:LytR/AlgR family response regulator transcription factor [Aquimarina sp. M1]
MMNKARKIRTVIIDDEPSGINNLKRLLTEFCPEVEILKCVSLKKDIKETFINSDNIDLVFLDVQIGDELIFNIVEDIFKYKFQIIFISAHDYALKSYQYNAINYLLKPIDINELTISIKRVSDILSKEEKNSTIKNQYQDSLDDKKPDEIMIPTSKGYEIVLIKSILYFVADGSYTNIILEGGKKIVVSKNIKTYEDKLASYSFLRIHKSFLINLKQIKIISKSDGGFVKMKDGKTLQISNSKKDAVFNEISFLN